MTNSAGPAEDRRFRDRQHDERLALAREPEALLRHAPLHEPAAGLWRRAGGDGRHLQLWRHGVRSGHRQAAFLYWRNHLTSSSGSRLRRCRSAAPSSALPASRSRRCGTNSIAACLAKDASARPQSAREIRAELENSTTVKVPGERFRRPALPRRRPCACRRRARRPCARPPPERPRRLQRRRRPRPLPPCRRAPGQKRRQRAAESR